MCVYVCMYSDADSVTFEPHVGSLRRCEAAQLRAFYRCQFVSHQLTCIGN